MNRRQKLIEFYGSEEAMKEHFKQLRAKVKNPQSPFKDVEFAKAAAAKSHQPKEK